MAEAMNRAMRPASAKARATPGRGGQTTTSVYLIPLELTEAYYRIHIAAEGGCSNHQPPVIITRPQAEFGRADEAWLQRTLGQMLDVRKPGTHRYVLPHEHGKSDIDIGLIDVQVYFHDTEGMLSPGHKTNENFAAVDGVCGGELHTQMVLASAVHRHRPDGSRILHYHNLIFSVRKEIEGDRVHLGVIDLLPLVKALGKGRTINVVEDV